MDVLFESEYVRVVDLGGYYCLEDKVKMQFPPLGRRIIDTFGFEEPVIVDLVSVDDNVAAARWYFPKTYPKNLILSKAKSLSESYEKRLRGL
jgi:hypothetical protein